MTALRRLFATVTLLLSSVTLASAAPALWQVSDGDSKIWLFGSFHILPPGTDWRTDVFDRTLAAADRVYFETDVGPEAQTAITVKSLQLGMNPLGNILNHHLDKADVATLRDTIEKLQLPVGFVQAMKPWFATATIGTLATVKAGYDPTSGVDIVLQKELPAERKAYFETGEEQLGFLANAPEAEQVRMLVDTIDRLDELPDVLDTMLKAWGDGTTDVLAHSFLEELAAYDTFTQRILFDRNTRWVATITALLAENEQDLIVVGAGHLVGDKSVVDLLEQQGFRVKRLQ